MNIKAIKFTYGEEIVSEVEENLNDLILINPVVLQIDQNPQTGKQHARMMPWFEIASSDGAEIKISKKNVLTNLPPIEQVRAMYDEAFGAGLIIPTSNIKV